MKKPVYYAIGSLIQTMEEAEQYEALMNEMGVPQEQRPFNFATEEADLPITVMLIRKEGDEDAYLCCTDNGDEGENFLSFTQMYTLLNILNT